MDLGELTGPPLERWRTWCRSGGIGELHELLLVWWDPSGVLGDPGTRDDYARHVPRLAGLLRTGAREADVAAHLRAVGLSELGDAGAADLAAERIVRWHDHVVASLRLDVAADAG